jgi:hypothetical protein
MRSAATRSAVRESMPVEVPVISAIRRNDPSGGGCGPEAVELVYLTPRVSRRVSFLV